MKLASSLILAAFMPVICLARTDVGCANDTVVKSQVVELQARLFAALGKEDRPAWDLLVAPDFLAFERGKQYNSGEFFGLIADAHKSGIKLVWSLTEPRVEVDCRLAVMSYVNVGSIAQPGAQPKPQRWLETVMFRRDSSGWHAVLVTSMRAEEI